MRIKHNAAEVSGGLRAYQNKLFDNIFSATAFSMAKIEASAKKYIIAKDIVSEGDLLKSITHEVQRLTDKLLGSVGSNVPHARFVHEGTRPHWPPVRAIEDWVRTQQGRGKIGPGDVRSIAFLVSRAISRRGTKGRPFLAVALRLNRDAMVNRIASAIRQA